jgi:ATP-binding cassette, subfamily G (WHITE), eye pigment precursor transporter
VKYLVDLAKSTNVPVIMTIHQPAAMVFDMLQDLYLLEGGRIAYFGPILSARPYFTSIGYDCPSGVNPADFYLDVIYKPPSLPAHEGMQWRNMYTVSPLGERMMGGVDSNANPLKKIGDAPPSNWKRMEIILTFFLKYYGTDPGYYLFRMVYLLLAAVYVGTIYLNLDNNTSELGKYSGAIFFSLWTVLFGAVGSTGLVAADRRQSFEQIKNGIISPLVYCVGQFIATIPYNLLCAIVFQAVFHWLTNINPLFVSFVYGIMLTFGLLTTMESLMFIVVEVVKDAMLSVTFAMVLLGTLFLFPGFFIQVDQMPDWISWLSYILPSTVSTLTLSYIFSDFVRCVVCFQRLPACDLSHPEL